MGKGERKRLSSKTWRKIRSAARAFEAFSETLPCPLCGREGTIRMAPDRSIGHVDSACTAPDCAAFISVKRDSDRWDREWYTTKPASKPAYETAIKFFGERNLFALVGTEKGYKWYTYVGHTSKDTTSAEGHETVRNTLRLRALTGI